MKTLHVIDQWEVDADEKNRADPLINYRQKEDIDSYQIYYIIIKN